MRTTARVQRQPHAASRHLLPTSHITRELARPGGHSEGPNTRSHPELGRENPQRPWYCRNQRRKSRSPPGPPSPPTLSSPVILPRAANRRRLSGMGSETLVLAIDQGTTSTRAILFDAAGQPRQSAQVALTQLHPRPGWVEHDPEEIWQSVVSTCREAIAGADGPIAAVGITNQRETTVLWERASGRPVNNAIVWQDRRTAALCERWSTAGLTEIVGLRTGLVIDPYFSASKIRWLLDNVPGLDRRARAGEIAFGTIDSFLLWRLSGGRCHATDVTNAARTMLFDIERLTWDAELLDAFGIPRALLPEVLDTGADYGATAPGVLGPAIPIAGIAGDQQAAAIGQACFRPGMIKTTYGTGAFALLNIGAEAALSRHKLLTTIAYRLDGATAYALEGSIFVAGAAVEWLRDRLGAIAVATEAASLAAQADPQQRLYL